MSVITTGNHPKHLLPGVIAFWGTVYDQHGEEWKQLFDSRTSNKNFEEIVQNNGFGLAPTKSEGGSIQYDQTNQGYTSRFTNVTYGLGYIVTREEIEDNLYETAAMDRARALKISMVETKENVHANIYNRAFNTSYVGGDGACLVSAAHPSSAGNQSNVLATAADLSEASLEDMVIQIMGAVNDRGLKIKLMPETLHVPRQLVFEAERILKSVQQSGSANNDVNALRSLGSIRGGVAVNHYFTDADAWFIRTNAANGMISFQRRGLEFTNDNDFDTENAKFKATERYVPGWGDWRGVYGTPGA